MTDNINGLNLPLFETISYVFPGLYLIVSISILSEYGLKIIQENLLLSLLFSYLIGNILHQLSESKVSISSLFWSVYHKFKEKDLDGHGIEFPTTLSGKMANFIRTHFLEPKKQNWINVTKLQAEKILKDKYNSKLNSFEIFQFKEVIMADKPNINSQCQYLHYQKIFNKSMSLVFFVLSVFYVIFDYYYILTISLTNQYFYKIDGFGWLISAILLFLFAVFKERYIFFNDYRNKVLDATVITSLQQKTK